MPRYYVILIDNSKLLYHGLGTLGMIIPASGGIGAFNLAMKYGFMALFLAMGKSAEFGGEMGLTAAAGIS